MFMYNHAAAVSTRCVVVLLGYLVLSLSSACEPSSWMSQLEQQFLTPQVCQFHLSLSLHVIDSHAPQCDHGAA